MEERIEIMSFDVLQDKIRGMKNPTVAGLDARIDYVPEQIRTACFEEYGKTVKGAAEAIYQFNCGLNGCPVRYRSGGKTSVGLL